MDTDEGTQSKGHDIAIWPSEVSHFMLNCLCKIKRDGKSGDNGLKKPVWQVVTLSINDRSQLKFELEQVRNHYRIWKARLRALCDLQNTSGMGWNEVESRFDAPQHFWNELKRKEQRYWKEHRVLSVHLAIAAWLGNEVANGNDSSHPPDAIHDDAFANPVPLEELHDLEVEQEETVFYDQTSVPSTPVESMSRTCGRPRSNASTSREKKKKTGAEKIRSPLKLIAFAISGLIQSDPLTDLGKKLNSAIDAIPGLDFQKCFREKQFLLRNKDSAILFLEAKEEDKMKVLEMVLPDGVANQ